MSAKSKGAKEKDRKRRDGGSDTGTGWKTAFTIACCVILFVTAVQNIMSYLYPTTGWDYMAYVSGVTALEQGQDPYLLQYQINGPEMTFNYPPHTLFLFRLLDVFFVFHAMFLYVLLLLLTLGASLYLILRIDDRPQYLFGITLVLAGFMAAFWNFLTLNTSVFFLLLLSVTFTLWKQERYLYSAIVMGLCAALTLFTAPFIALFLALERPVRERLELIGVSAGVVAGLFCIGYLLNPPFLSSYLSLMTSQKSPFLDGGGWSNPTPYLLFRDIGGILVPGSLVPGILLSCIFICCVAYGAWYFWQRNRNNTLLVLSFLMLSIFLLLPRLKPYNFIILVLPLYLLFKDRNDRTRLLVVAILSLPIAGWLLYTPLVSTDLWSVLVNYSQAFALFLIFALAVRLTGDTALPRADKPS